jgi:hypothetical protein
VHKLTDGVSKRKDNSLLSVNDSPTELCLNTIILGDKRIIESLFDEDGSELTVRHGTILAVLWRLMTSM